MGQDDFSPSTATSSPRQLWPAVPFAATPTPCLQAYVGGSPWAMQELGSGDQRRGVHLITLLGQCAFEVAAGSFERANACLESINLLLSPHCPFSPFSPLSPSSPDSSARQPPMHRLAAIFTDALARRLLRRPLPGVYWALLSPGASSDPLLLAAARRHFFDLCLFLKLAFLTTNQAILEAIEGERVVHILDLAGPAAEPAQWVALLQALRARPEGPPHLRITAVHDDPDSLHRTSALLAKEADAHDMSFQFHPVVSRLDSLDFDNLRIKTGEALAVSSVLQFHPLLADDAAAAAADAPRSKSNNSILHHRPTPPHHHHHLNHLRPSSFGELLERELRLSPTSSDPASLSLSFSSPPPKIIDLFLSKLLRLAPKIMVVTEQEANHNGAAFCERFSESLHYYAALFDCLETTAPRAAVERGRVEKLLLGEEIKNIVACEGAERRERHEPLKRWVQRLEFAGFGRVPLSYDGMLEARKLLQSSGCDKYKVQEDDGCFFFCWQDRPLYSVSAWRCRRSP